jgi:type III restriction enzyme
LKLHFDPNQSYQIEAIKSVTDIFEGQPMNKGDFEFSMSPANTLIYNEFGVANKIALSEKQILKNLQGIQKANGVMPSAALDGMNFSVEMETGTGKTYVYLRSIYELNKKYGFKKFIIVVPSIAIREGVLKNLEITAEHFQMLYEKVPAKFFVYDSSNVSNLRSFALSNNIQMLVINIDSFANDTNVINKVNDRLTGRKPIEFIRGTNPIVIVDEPQNMETEIRKRAIANLNPACTLRYSATHTNVYNLVYSLNPVNAYDMGLVKQIEVDSVYTENDFNLAYVGVKDFKATKSKISVKLEIDTQLNDRPVRKAITAEIGDDLYELSGKRDIYKDGFVIESIDVPDECVEFTNGVKVHRGESRGGLTDEIMKVQIEKTIDEHMRKEKKYKSMGIKVLSLFFIDRVANYRTIEGAKGKFAEWFEQIFKKYSQKPEYKGVIPFRVEDIHDGYFAQDKNKKYKDSSEGCDTQADDAVYQLIMKNKEKLLDTNEPLRFIFSHSALREGWDNPNVFQICTLNETKSELKKRQEIGRGLRLSVNNNGERIFDKNINKLTVIANESYEEFAEKLQKEIEDDCGVEFKDRVKNANNKTVVRLKKGYQLDKNFIALWDKIKHKTTYRVNYETDTLVAGSVKAIKEMEKVQRPVVKSVRTGLDMAEEGIVGRQLGGDLHYVDPSVMEIPDIYAYIEDKTQLTRSTIHRVLNESGRMEDVLKNPQLFLDMAVKEIKDVMNKLMIDGIKYEKIGGAEYEMKLFDGIEIESYLENLHKVKNTDKTITNYVEIMSEPERKFAEDCETREDVEFYIKLPHWFEIKTPIGMYQPDWALVFKNEKKLYFVAETKSSLNEPDRRVEENMKIKCGKSHFAEFPEVEYKVVRNVGELKG